MLFYDTHVAWKSVNTWDNRGFADNYYTDDLGGGDSDAYVRRP